MDRCTLMSVNSMRLNIITMQNWCRRHTVTPNHCKKVKVIYAFRRIVWPKSDRQTILRCGNRANRVNHGGQAHGVTVARDGISNVPSWPQIFAANRWTFTPAVLIWNSRTMTTNWHRAKPISIAPTGWITFCTLAIWRYRAAKCPNRWKTL